MEQKKLRTTVLETNYFLPSKKKFSFKASAAKKIIKLALDSLRRHQSGDKNFELPDRERHKKWGSSIKNNRIQVMIGQPDLDIMY